MNVYGSKPSGGGGSAQLTVTPSTSCVDSDSVSITVNPASCVGTLLPFIETYFVNSYSYSKDNLGYGQETWAFTSKPIIPGFAGTIVMLRGIAEGTIATGPGIMTSLQMGVTVDEVASNDSLGAQIEGESGSVQGGTPGIGNFDIQRHVIVTQIGAAVGKNTSVDGLSGEASIQIPVSTVFI